MAITKKQASKLKCMALLDLAQAGDKNAQEEIYERARNWDTCAVGEQAMKLKVDPKELYQRDPKIASCSGIFDPTTQLEHLGMRFFDEVDYYFYGKAKRTYRAIERRVKQLFGTKAKRQKLGLEA